MLLLSDKDINRLKDEMVENPNSFREVGVGPDNLDWP